VTTTKVQEGKQLDLVFTVPTEIKRAYKSKSVEYVEELIGHEGHGRAKPQPAQNSRRPPGGTLFKKRGSRTGQEPCVEGHSELWMMCPAIVTS
jgi:hypothetical protein